MTKPAACSNNLEPHHTQLQAQLQTPSDLCTHCSKDKTEDLVHALFECDFNGCSGPFLLNILKDVSTSLHPQQLLLLDLDLADERRLPVVYSISCVLSCIWRHRLEKKSIDTHKVRATMEASINILRKSRFRKSAEMVDRWLEKIQSKNKLCSLT